MLGAIIGDIVGQPFEFNNIKTKDFLLVGDHNLFTDDSVMTIAVADGIMSAGTSADPLILKRAIIESMQHWGRKYPYAGYGGKFYAWLYADDPKPYNSWGNGSAMRVSAIPWLFPNDLEQALSIARISAEVTHNHPEGIKGAECTVAIVWLINQQYEKDEIEKYVKKHYYSLEKTCDEIRPDYQFDVSCMGTMPVAIQAFLESENYMDCLRLAVSMGGDSDTICAIAGAMAEAYYGIPHWLQSVCMKKLEPDMQAVLKRFQNQLAGEIIQ